MTPKTLTNFRIDSELLDGLDRIRERDGVPVSEQVRRAIRDWLKKKGVTVEAPSRRSVKRRKG